MNKKVKMNNKCQLELLAPAGNMDKLKTAFLYGADAVYLGIPDFSLRVRINDFDLKGVKAALEYAHKNGKKVYITVNIFAHNKHLSAFVSYLKKIRNLKPDAFIASDPGIISLIKQHCPEIEIHLSTQANCTNLESARFWFKQGISRVVLGREVSLSEIKKIHRSLPKLELEYFIHGAMCMAYSGRCFLSKMFVDRSGNLGDCAQPCRWQYDTSRYKVKAEGHEEELELVEEEHGTYLLNSKDLCLMRELKELIGAGIVSFKIEGRAKSVYYQAVVCSAYRQGLNISQKIKNKEELDKQLAYLYKELETKLVHRGYTTGFLKEHKGEQNIDNARVDCAWEFCGQVVDKSELNKEEQAKLPKNVLVFKVHNTIKVGDIIEIILPEYEIIKIKLKKMYSLKNLEEVEEAHGGGGGAHVYIELPKNTKLPKGLSVVRRKIS
ncbi:MAG TPA: peptidase U32 family protein [Patescibacteria group bacterium]|nr:peptidase U32 family protein [Patescibacteria group bacterium]